MVVMTYTSKEGDMSSGIPHGTARVVVTSHYTSSVSSRNMVEDEDEEEGRVQ
jgi:hypothetical protein